LGGDYIQNVIQAMPQKPDLHKDHGLDGDVIALQQDA
jgi:hypothetical protein